MLMWRTRRIWICLSKGTIMTTFTSWDAELYHHGIKGQKWGIRRFQNEDGTLTAAGKKRYLNNHEDRLKGKYQRKFFKGRSSNLTSKGKKALSEFGNDSELGIAIRSEQFGRKVEKNWVDSYNKVAGLMNDVYIPKLNEKYKKVFENGRPADDDPEYQAYLKEYADTLVDVGSDVFLKDFGEHPSPAIGKSWVEMFFGRKG